MAKQIPSGGTPNDGVFRLETVTDMDQIPGSIWDTLIARFGIKRHELPTYGGGSVFTGRFPGLDSIQPSVAEVLVQFDGTVVPA